MKNKISKLVSAEADQYLGMSMTYSLFEFVKERFEELIQDLPEEVIEQGGVDEEVLDTPDAQVINVKYCVVKLFVRMELF